MKLRELLNLLASHNIRFAVIGGVVAIMQRGDWRFSVTTRRVSLD